MIRWGYRSVMWRMLKSTWRCGPTGNHTRSRIPISGCPCIVGWGHDIRPCGVVGRLLSSGCIVIGCCGPRTFTCRQFLASWKQLERISIVIEYRFNVCVQWTCFVLPRVHSLKKYDVKSQILDTFRSSSAQNLPSVIVPLSLRLSFLRLLHRTR